MTLIDGKAISEQVKQEIATEVAEIVARGGKRPHLAAILVGHDGGSETYVAAKVKACEACGFKSSLIRYETDVTEEELLAKVRELNEDADVDGFIVQLPLPKHISEQKVIETIDYRKDVDGFHPINVGRMSIGLPCYVSATPNGILELLKRYKIETSGKKCVVLGRSNIVGKPMAALMMQKAYPGDATVTVCHSRSKDLVKECQEADIIIAAMGQPNFVKKRRQELTASFYGLTKHADCKNLFYKLTGKKMKKLKDLGYKYKPKDGRKRFTGARIKSPELMNKDVIVLDYEKDVPTKNGNRTVIKLELDGKERKYFTSLEETLFICESAARDGELPFEAHCEGEVSEKGLIIIHFT